MAYHQQMLAVFRSRVTSQICSPWMRALCWRHRKTSPRSRKYHPLPTMPWSRGIAPVTMEACTEQVTAGSTGLRAGGVAQFRHVGHMGEQARGEPDHVDNEHRFIAIL